MDVGIAEEVSREAVDGSEGHAIDQGDLGRPGGSGRGAPRCSQSAL